MRMGRIPTPSPVEKGVKTACHGGQQAQFTNIRMQTGIFIAGVEAAEPRRRLSAVGRSGTIAAVRTAVVGIFGAPSPALRRLLRPGSGCLVLPTAFGLWLVVALFTVLRGTLAAVKTNGLRSITTRLTSTTRKSWTPSAVAQRVAHP